MRPLVLAKDIARRIELGHPWIYRDALEAPARPLAAGKLVDVATRSGAVVARGFYDPRSPIAVRVLSRNGRVTDELLEERVARACALRRAAGIDADALRLVHGEADGMPGLVLDHYAGVTVAQLDGAGAEAFWRPRFSLVARACAAAGYPPATLVEKGGGHVLGARLRGAVTIREGRARYEVDVARGQKTGFFLDQRENRFRAGRLAAGLEVLNLFAYTGGFSVEAALSGAARVTTVDQAAPAIEAARRNLERNRGAPAQHELVVADVFAFLDGAIRAGRSWDLVICDPPSFARSERARKKGLAAYRKLNALCARVVTRGGLLLTASCSSHVNEAAFLQAVAEGCREAGRSARLLDVRGAGPDHPTLPAFPEGRYLSFLVLRLD